ncbi:MAG TPA: aromatic ring-hydroxylating dioxygenase subunit alpha [Rhizomicrobium sp.]|nr:aromatic ring-hydroxylating dioxygenase subunit alpha [Rhizomicrobium sp.]
MKKLLTSSNHPTRKDRCDAISYQELLDRDTMPVPAALREQSEPDLGTSGIPIEHYTSQDYFDRSVGRMWLKTWQMACREQDIPEVGNFVLYEVVGKSLIIVRSGADQIKALHNSCLHRGRKLVTLEGSKSDFHCPFHGLVWKNDGTFLENPIQWDFPQCPAEEMRLPEAKVARWGGFVFINFDLDAPSLESTLGPIPKHFERWDIENRYKAAHVGKIIACNWMVALEAFIEAHHSLTTHPQILMCSGDANAQHDIFSDHVTRMISAKATPSPFLGDRIVTEDEIVRCMVGRVRGGRGFVDQDSFPKAEKIVPEETTARAYLASFARAALRSETGIDHSIASDAELGDSILYNVFPNLTLWGGFLPNLVYRWRPNGLDHASCLMEVMILRPRSKGTAPKSSQFHLLKEDEAWADAEELGGLGAIIDQDMGNMPFVQQGLVAAVGRTIEVGKYSESRIRAHHITLTRYVEG